ncbi:peptidase M14 [Xylophilus sp. GOD-11R]|uniref:peptidase M14 n=1 Tax=Xylophilus sp. GOD-11R TaxID=3089814 RepID=UPI00298C316E|nr:peptidase M14 [Xylophilus sp. GOD-11R]WPB56440.1 peptidase M14 [Xylophilus sp. GOD-11R]
MTVLLDIAWPRTLDTWVAELSSALPARAGRPAVIEGWLFEGPQARRRAERRLAAAGLPVRLRSAYKPLVFHFLEEVERDGLRAVTVHYPLHAAAPARRFALEAYPLAMMLEGVDFQLLPQPATSESPVYHVELRWHDGRQRMDRVFAPNRVHLDTAGETVLSPTAWLAGEARDDDHARVFGAAIDAVRRHPWPEQEPYFERLDLRVDIPGVHHAPAEETGWIDSHEALHEDLYFSLLEVFERRAGRSAGSRALQPGQIVPDIRGSEDGMVRLLVSVTPWRPVVADDAVDEAPLARATSPLSAGRIARVMAEIGGERFAATSVQGRPVRWLYREGGDAPVLISGGQHANECSGVVGALRVAQRLAARPPSHFALIALENPDGYALHRELCRQAPRHLHHAARYSALGDDVEARSPDAPPYEAAARRQALARSGALLHINLHGYPAHEWTRPWSGYIPRGFSAWTVPKGFFLIVRHHAGWGERARALARAVCAELARRPALAAFNRQQLAHYRMHAGELPFELIDGIACAIAEVDRPGAPVTLITEFPDETVHGQRFLLAQQTQTAAAWAAVRAWQSLVPGAGPGGDASAA